METESIIKKLIEDTNVIKNKDNLLVILYGSRITGYSHKDSDLDVFIVTSSQFAYRERITIDGIPIDINKIPISLLEEDIYYSYFQNSNYYYSVYTIGRVIKNVGNLYETNLDYIQDVYKLKKKVRKEIKPQNAVLLRQTLTELETSKEEKRDLYYYNAIEMIREIYHFLYNHTQIHPLKVYTLYENEKYAKDAYHLELPPAHFRQLFLDAIFTSDSLEKERYLDRLLETIPFDRSKYYLQFSSKPFYTDSACKLKLISFHNKMESFEKKVKLQEKALDFQYHILLYALYQTYSDFYGESTDYVESLFKRGILVSEEERLTILNDLFKALEGSYKMNYKQYRIRMQ